MITLTESAVNRVEEMVAKREAAIGLRIGVTESGCSGYSYAMDFAESVNDNDIVIDQGSIKIIIDETSMPILDGVELDFVKQGLNQNFKFNNPNVISSCGCGESFSTTK
ncbi:MAG: iron-sulfur cluster assembly accessory protein [Gammaproteobacteria bacterium]|nr:iron-sulfur cluster assembly accessory protein [Gammaproteobacteria bacterium]